MFKPESFPLRGEKKEEKEKKPTSKEDINKMIADAKGTEESQEELIGKEMKMMEEAQKQVRIETQEMKSEGFLSKFSPKMKRALLITFAGATLFFAAGNFEKAEARRGYNYSDVLGNATKDVLGDVIRNYPRQQEQRRMERERQKQMQEMQRQREQEQIRREMEQKKREFDRQRQQALSEYQRDISRAKNQKEEQSAMHKYQLKIQAIDQAEEAFYEQQY